MGVPDVTCVPIGSARASLNGVDLGMGIIGLLGFLVTGFIVSLGAITVVAASAPVLAVWAALMMIACLMLINVANQALLLLFHYKLACIDGERCAFGQVMKIELNVDGDTTFDMKLAPIQATTTPAEFQGSFQGSSLVFSDPGAASRGWVFKPESGAGFVDSRPIPLFHCEIEGSYLNDWITAILALLWTLMVVLTALLALAVTLTALELIPVIGWAIAAIAFLAALFAAILGIHMKFGKADSVGSTEPDVPVSDLPPGATGPVLTDAANNKVAVNDFIVLTGLHTLDCGHAEDKNDDGSPKGTWCEIHPVRAIGKTDQVSYDNYSAATTATPPDNSLLDRYCAALTGFVASHKDALTATAQQPLEHPRIG
jgi:hypothetical protein